VIYCAVCFSCRIKRIYNIYVEIAILTALDYLVGLRERFVGIMVRECPVCACVYLDRRGLRKHLLTAHSSRFRRGSRDLERLQGEDLVNALADVRWKQRNSSQRRADAELGITWEHWRDAWKAEWYLCEGIPGSPQPSPCHAAATCASSTVRPGANLGGDPIPDLSVAQDQGCLPTASDSASSLNRLSLCDVDFPVWDTAEVSAAVGQDPLPSLSQYLLDPTPAPSAPAAPSVDIPSERYRPLCSPVSEPDTVADDLSLGSGEEEGIKSSLDQGVAGPCMAESSAVGEDGETGGQDGRQNLRVVVATPLHPSDDLTDDAAVSDPDFSFLDDGRIFVSGPLCVQGREGSFRMACTVIPDIDAPRQPGWISAAGYFSPS
jgi:uncharacterized C2H2 Zn-finger protein